MVAAVRSAVVTIPASQAAAYGEIGLAAGIGPRQAGRAVSLIDGDVPWWRVVYAGGARATCHGEAPGRYSKPRVFRSAMAAS
ncbi:hypothetical protein GCM10025784_02470 [Citricoccus nitrophenolicus]